MRQSDLATLFDFMYWANRRILQTAARLTNAQFTLPSVIVGRDLRATLVHTLDTECSWRLRLQGRPEDSPNIGSATRPRYARGSRASTTTCWHGRPTTQSEVPALVLPAACGHA